jgi:hypothetical protein
VPLVAVGEKPHMSLGFESLNRENVFTPEQELLWCAARQGLNEHAVDRIEEILRAGVEWSGVLYHAQRHRLVPMLYHGLTASCAGLVPPPQLAILKSLSQRAVGQGLFLVAEMLRILETFRKEGITAVAFKGPVLAELAYRSVALRQFDDLDILVSESDVFRARRLLLSQGYQISKLYNFFGDKHHLRWRCAFSLEHHKTHVHVDLHWKFTKPGFSFPFDTNSLLKRLVVVQVGGREVLSFPIEDVVLLHCVHGAKHLWNRLEWIYSLDRLVSTHSYLDWARICGEAKKLRSERMLLLGLAVARCFYMTDLPGWVVQKIEADRFLPSLTRSVRGAVFFDEALQVHEARRGAFHLRTREKWRDRLRCFLYFVQLRLRPTEQDRKAVRLHRSLSFVYYMLRPLRLVWVYGLQPLRSFLHELRSR